MNRRELGALTGLAVAGLAGRTEAQVDRDIFELRRYSLTDDQRPAFTSFLGQVAAPALQRLGVGPVGLFEQRDGQGDLWMLCRHPSLDSVLTLNERALADADLVRDGAAVVDAVRDKPAFSNLDSRLLLAFAGLPKLEQPVSGEGRVYQLRIYESPSPKTGLKKIEMFNTAELAIFRECGMNPVFFAQTVIGDQMPNLTYLLGFESPAAQQAAWGKFRVHPDWLKLRARPEYADSRIIRKITNLDLQPLPGSQV